MSSDTLVHPAKAVGRNEMPLGTDTHVVPSNTVLDRGTDPPREGEIWGSKLPNSQRRRLLPNYFGPCFTIIISVPGRVTLCSEHGSESISYLQVYMPTTWYMTDIGLHKGIQAAHS